MPTYPREVDHLLYEARLKLCLRLLDVQSGLMRLQWAVRGRALGKYKPDQPRVPAGRPDGGQFTFDDDPLGIGTIDGLVDDGDDAESIDAGERILLASAEPYPPAYRANRTTLTEQIWKEFNDAVAASPNTTPTKQHIYSEVFAAEGGAATDPKNGAASGITGTILRRTQGRNGVPGLEGIQQPEQLTLAQRAAIYDWYFDKVALHDVSNGGTRLGAISDRDTAAAFADSLFNHGATGGAGPIRKAINAIVESFESNLATTFGLHTVDPDGAITDEVFDVFENLAKAGYGDQFREMLAEKRLVHLLEVARAKARRAEARARREGKPIPKIVPKISKGDRDRVEHFRFRRGSLP
jgi:lysozyme family protein